MTATGGTVARSRAAAAIAVSLRVALGLVLTLIAIAAVVDKLWLASGIAILAVVFLLPGRVAVARARYGLMRGRSLALSILLLVAALACIGATYEETPADKIQRVQAERDAANAGLAQKRVKAAAMAEAVEIKRRRGRDEFLAQYRAMLTAAAPCDAAVREASTLSVSAGNSSDVVDAYSKAQDARNSCAAAWQTISAITPTPGISEPGAAALKNAVEICSNAYFIRRRAMDGLMKVLDGNSHASTIVAVRDDIKAAGQGPLLCVAQWFVAADKAGISAEEMKSRPE